MPGLLRRVGTFNAGASQRSIDVYHTISLRYQRDFFTGFDAYWNDGFNARSSGYLTGFFPTGAAAWTGIATTPQIGTPVLYAISGGGLVRDFYSLIAPGVRLIRPTKAIADPFAVWEVEAHLTINPLAAALTEDCGLIFHGSTSITGYAGGFVPGGAVANPGNIGFSISYFGGPAAPSLRFFARKAAAGAVTEGTDLPHIAGSLVAPRVIRLLVRLEAATPTSDAKVRIYADEELQLTRFLADGTTMPSAENMNAPQQWLGRFRPFLRCSNNPGANTALNLAFLRVSAAPSVALMGSPAPA